MLPDFATMVRVRLLEVRDPLIRRGIDRHHETDSVFHRAPAFRALCTYALTELTRSGVRRGTARAVGHIGRELFLDGWLSGEQTHIDGYLTALDDGLVGHLRWQDEGLAFSKLHERLRLWGAPHDYAKPPFVLARLIDALRHRPALALVDEEREQVSDFLPSFQRMVERDAPQLLHQLRDALGCRG